jgi:dTDP-4-dehydrorhamnose reductase
MGVDMNDQKKIIFTGGSGLLGTAFKKNMPGINYPSSAEFNITDSDQMEKYISSGNYSMIIHAAAFTSPPKVDQNPIDAIDANIIGTANIVKLCVKFNLRLIYISTDYVFQGDKGSYTEEDPVLPVNKYAWSKLGGEASVRMLDNSLIIRTTFGPDIFPYEKAFVDQWTSRESVSKIAELIASLLDKEINGILHVGGSRKTVYEYATALSPEKTIGKLSVNDINFKVPSDTSLDCSRFYKITKNN